MVLIFYPNNLPNAVLGSPTLALFQLRLCVLYNKYSLAQQKLCRAVFGDGSGWVKMINERLSKQWPRKDLRDFLGGWGSGFGKGVLPEWSVSKESQKRLIAVRSGTELWVTTDQGGWQADTQKASAKTEGGVARQGSKRWLSLWEDSQGHGLCWPRFFQPYCVNCG